MPTVHPSATVSDNAELADDVVIGPGCVINGQARLGAGVRLVANAHIEGPVTIGDRTIVYPGACLGFPAQDVKFALGDPTAGVVIGKNCQIREHVTVHSATNDHTPTTIGDEVFMMVGSHAGHDARIGDRCVLVNYACLAGHTEIHDAVTMSGHTALHQFCRIGRLSFMAGGTAASTDVPPFCIVVGANRLGGINVVGMRRAGIDRAEISAVRHAFRTVFRDRLGQGDIIEALREQGEHSPAVMEMHDFITEADRPIAAGPGSPPRGFIGWVRAVDRGEMIEDERV